MHDCPWRRVCVIGLMPATANAKMTGAGTGRAGAAPAGRSLPSQELLDDLCSRFVLNAPEEELQAFERIFFLVEQAHWFYEDNTVDQNPGLKTLTLREFASLMFQSCAALRPYISHIDDIYKDFTTYKVRVPVTGAIILDESFERCLLVKGWKAGASWSFPRGKKNKDEEDHRCAAREVWEETGFDIAGLIQLNDFVEVTMAGQRLRLYIIGGVKSDTVFEPQTRKEISEIAWHRVDELPTASNETSHNRGPTGIKYFMVWPFMADLRKWISSYHPLLPKSDAVHVGKSVWKVKANAGPGASNGPGILAAPVVPQLPLAASLAPAPTPEALAAPLLPTPVPTAAARSTITPDKHRSSRAPPGNSFRSFRIDATKIVPLDFTPEPQAPGNKSNLDVQ